jgi:hypothetical protein
VTWIAAMVAAFMFLGLRRRTTGGSTHMTMLMVILCALGAAYLGLVH